MTDRSGLGIEACIERALLTGVYREEAMQPGDGRGGEYRAFVFGSTASSAAR
jgi:hypothetical protein